MSSQRYIGIDLGGTNIRAVAVQNGKAGRIASTRLEAKAGEQQVLQQIFALVDPLFTSNTTAIGIGVPGLVDRQEQLVYDVVNIPAWKRVPLQQWMQQHYGVPVFADNDANCFALGEYHFGAAQKTENMLGLTIGTGLGSGIIIDGKLYSGRNGGAGEFGMIPYLGQVYEYYASGQFFQNVYQLDGAEVFRLATAGDAHALRLYQKFGGHLGNAIQAILFALDIERVVIGGSVKDAFPFYAESMWEQIRKFPYQQAVKHLHIDVSALQNAGLLGAAALAFQP